MSYTTTISNNNVTISLDTTDISVSLSRTGGQGAKGDSWTDTLSTEEDQAVPLYDTDSSSWTAHRLTTRNLSDVADVAPTDGSLLIYNGTTSKYTPTTNLDNDNLILSGGTF